MLLNESSINTFGHDTALDVVVDGNAIEAWDTAHGVKPAATKATAKLIGRNTSNFKVDLSLQLLLRQKSIPVVLYTLEIAGEDDIFVPHALVSSQKNTIVVKTQRPITQGTLRVSIDQSS